MAACSAEDKGVEEESGTVESNKQSNKDNVNSSDDKVCNVNRAQSQRGVGVLPTFLAYAYNPKKKGKAALIRVLADSGSQVTLIGQETAEKLCLGTTRVRDMGIGVLGGGQNQQVLAQANIKLQSRIYKRSTPTLVAYVLPQLVNKVNGLKGHPHDLYPSIKETGLALADEWPQERGIKIDMIVGQDYLWSCYTGRTIVPKEGTAQGPICIDSPFGLILQGWLHQEPGEGPVACLGTQTCLKVPKGMDVETQEKEPRLERLLRQLFELEAYGIKEPANENLTPTQSFAVEYLEANLKFDNNDKRFTVKIPINPKSERLRSNVGQARMRFESLRRNLRKDKEKEALYREAMNKYLQENHAQPIDAEDAECTDIFYLPHSPVFTKGASGELKTRIVFDCAARDKAGNSLNSSFAVGPVPDADLLRILTSWRSKRHALNTDVKACFLNIKLHKSQQNLFRFLWSDDLEKEPQTYKFTSLIFGSSVSPWISSTCLFKTMERAEDHHPELVRRLRRALWVDDFLLSVDTVEEGREIIRQMEEIFASASFSLAKFVATAPQVLENVRDEQKLFQDGDRPDVKALGVLWRADDSLGVAPDFVDVFRRSAGAETKRTLARAVASVYDPLQLFLPWKLGGTLILRDTWDQQKVQAEAEKVSKTAKKFWDQLLDDATQKRIDTWKQDVERLSELYIPRYLADPSRRVVRQELWGFSDASPEAFGAVLYMKSIYKVGRPTSTYIVSRGKVNSKGYTLPRMELLGAKFLARLTAAVKEYLDLGDQVRVLLFSDSEIALHWLTKNPECWKQFVANQVTAIQSLTRKDDWHHVPGTDNPADILTRPKSVVELIQNWQMWTEGPEFIKTGALPAQPDLFDAIKGQDLEIKPAEILSVNVAAMLQGNEVIAKWTDECSDVRKLVRKVALVRRAAYKLFHRFTRRRFPERFSKEAERSGPLFADLEEQEEAYGELVRVIQCRAFPEELDLLAKGQPVGGKSRLRELKPFLDERNLIRASGRIESANDLPYNWLYPLVLPSDDELLGRIILDVHHRNQHLGVDGLHAELRQRFWILRARATIKRYKNRCLICRRYDGKRLEPSIAPLPKERMDVLARPFSHVAMDGFGPLQIKTKNGKLKKCWVLLFTCYLTRGINMEILEDLSCSSFVKALRLHISIRGAPVTLRLDNLSSHIKMSHQITALQQWALEEEFKEHLSKRGITFSFSRVSQPSTNGVVERMVRTAKSSLAKALHRQTVDKEDLYIFLREASSLINNRPLTQVHQGDTDDHIAVTPHHLIYGHRLDLLPFAADYEIDLRKKVGQIWTERQKLSYQFRTLFIDGYLAELRKQKKWATVTENIKVGDLVVVAEPNAKRRNWPIAVVSEVEANKHDSVVRTVRLRLADKFITRSVRSLILLRHLPDYESREGQGGGIHEGDVADPPRDKKLRFVTSKQANAQQGKKCASSPP